MSEKTGIQEAIDALEPKLACVNRLISDLETAKVELAEFDTIGELDEAIETVGNIKTDIDIEIGALKVALEK